MEQNIRLFSDGGSRSNPGPAALGFVIMDEKGEILLERGEYLGIKTNNEAEYLALLAGMKAARDFDPTLLECYLDSALVVNQVNGVYRVKNERMGVLCHQVQALIPDFPRVVFQYIPREKNKRADQILNGVLDQARP